ncbi:DNA phosphorothioation system sulfurtransferase DndC [Sphingomonas sp. Leaf25]|uniref:DNA phosphorothioation system sulfurtransferase DndC n=1 Tax=Sphingomonas sp. Leaf25 TaxID=1735692 RepID=UPI0006F72B1E|nr:DNA phosphorothioation system sulfurtransferase DndC [Sphingomonas sp. Leaf25]KQM98012.1 sulfurtransferase DndC [Sphingomonas sp. Leaf25]
MSTDPASRRAASAFADGFKAAIARMMEEIVELYRADEIPWIIGYSGGKDSTATLQAVWLALSSLPKDQLHKPVHVISTDTLVENPVVAAWVSRSLDLIGQRAKAAGLPITSHRLTPDPINTFWVNLIGRGYPAPRPKFRWCTERLKIDPSNRFIGEVTRANGESIVVLGMRKAESGARTKVMERLEGQRLRDGLSPNASLPNSYVYTPIETWTNDDVWLFLMQVQNPWGFDNRDLLTMYQGASADGECPLVIDASTPSCGDSRFGCWVCTLVDKDKSMQAMIQNDQEKEWMTPLLALRDELDVRSEETGKRDDRHLRDFRRMNGSVQLHNDRLIHGPYTQDARSMWLRRVLEAQTNIRREGPPEMAEMELLTPEELHEIRRLWVFEKHETEDLLPGIYETATGKAYDGPPIADDLTTAAEDTQLLKEMLADDALFALTRELLDVERRHRTMTRRAGLFRALENSLRRGVFLDAEEATTSALERRAAFSRDDGPAAPELPLSEIGA